MPRRYWIPLRLREWPLQHHVHAALTAWFDGDRAPGAPGAHEVPAVAGHGDRLKPYTISCPTVRDGVPGVEISTLAESADDVIRRVASERPVLRLGRQPDVLVGAPVVALERTWDQISRAEAPSGGGWRIEFLTPTMFRTGDVIDLLPTPARVLGAAVAECRRAIPGAVPDESLGLFRQLRTSELRLETSDLAFGPMTYTGLVGHLTYRCDDAQVAQALAPLFAALPFTGVGSYRVRGLGCVEVTGLGHGNARGYARRQPRPAGSTG